MPKILCLLPICINPTNKMSCKNEIRIKQYIDGLNKFFEFNNDTFIEQTIDIVIFDNTINTTDQIPQTMKNIFPKNVKILFNIVNNFGCINKGAGLIEMWLYNKELISEYDFLIHFEPRQLLKSNQFIESFLEKKCNLFTMNKNTPHFNTGLFCVDTKILINYIRSINLNNFISQHICFEDSIYNFFKNNKINFEILDKMDLIWFPYNQQEAHM